MARSSESFAKMRDEKRRQILKESLSQFSSKGLYATRIKDIAEGVGMAQGLVYNYFESKEEIYTELVSSALSKLIEAADLFEKADIPAQEILRLSIERLLQTIQESDEFCETCRFISQAMTSSAIPEEAKATLAKKRDIPYEIIGNVMRRGQREGVVVEGDPDELAVLSGRRSTALRFIVRRAKSAYKFHVPISSCGSF